MCGWGSGDLAREHVGARVRDEHHVFLLRASCAVLLEKAVSQPVRFEMMKSGRAHFSRRRPPVRKDPPTRVRALDYAWL